MVIFLFFSVSSWSGSFFILDSPRIAFLVLVTFTYLFILIVNNSVKILKLSSYLVLLSILFFCRKRFIHTYIVLEASRVPLLILLLGFGRQVEKVRAMYYLLFYIRIFRFPFLFVYSLERARFSLLPFSSFSYAPQLIFYRISLIYLVKFPLYLLHLWLPKVHVESPTESSILLARLLLKIGTYGFTRLLSIISWLLHFPLEVICFLGILVGSFICCTSSDTKSLVAYSSVVHISFLLLLIICSTSYSKNRGVLLIVFHGYASTLLFYIVGVLYKNWGVRIIYLSNSLWSISAVSSLLVIISFIANAGVPPFIGFFGEVFGILSLLSSTFMFLLFFLVYYILGFYYSLRLGVSLLVGKSPSSFRGLLTYPLVGAFYLLRTILFIFI